MDPAEQHGTKSFNAGFVHAVLNTFVLTFSLVTLELELVQVWSVYKILGWVIN